MIRFSLVSLFLMFPSLGVVHSFHSSKPITLLKSINVKQSIKMSDKWDLSNKSIALFPPKISPPAVS